jgi:hypothetical protein
VQKIKQLQGKMRVEWDESYTKLWLYETHWHAFNIIGIFPHLKIGKWTHCCIPLCYQLVVRLQEWEKTVYINIDTSFCKFSLAKQPPPPTRLLWVNVWGFLTFACRFSLSPMKWLKSNGMELSCIKFQACFECAMKRRKFKCLCCFVKEEGGGLCLCMSLSICVMSNGFCTVKLLK